MGVSNSIDAGFDVFINYRNSTDSEIANELFLELSRTNTPTGRTVRTFLDERCLTYGEKWREGFLRSLHRSKVVVLLMSPEGLDGIRRADAHADNLLLEYEVALHLKEEEKVQILPVFLGDRMAFQGYLSCQVFPNARHRHPDSVTSNTVRQTMQSLFAIQGMFVPRDNAIGPIIEVIREKLPTTDDELSPIARIISILLFFISTFGLLEMSNIFSGRWNFSSLDPTNLTPEGIEQFIQDQEIHGYEQIRSVDDILNHFPDVKENIRHKVEPILKDFDNIPDDAFTLAKRFKKPASFRFMKTGISSLMTCYYQSSKRFQLDPNIDIEATEVFKNIVTNFDPKAGWFLHILGDGEDSIHPRMLWYDREDDVKKKVTPLHDKRYSITYVAFSGRAKVEYGWIYNLSHTTIEFKMRRKEFDTYEELFAWYRNVTKK